MSKAGIRNRLALFFALVFIVEWALVLALVTLSPIAVGLIALVPTPVALLVAARLGGRGWPIYCARAWPGGQA